MKNIPVFLIALFLQVNLLAQPVDKQKKNDIATDKVLYTVGYAHLDTEWLWDYPSTISEYIKNTMEENFLLFEKYPDYVFNFTGSRRYNMMKEYYPALYKKVKEYIKKKRWNVSGSSIDEGEVNISSSESLIVGIEEMSICVYGCRGLLKNSRVVAISQILPRYMIATRSATLRIRLRSWLMKR